MEPDQITHKPVELTAVTSNKQQPQIAQGEQGAVSTALSTQMGETRQRGHISGKAAIKPSKTPAEPAIMFPIRPDASLEELAGSYKSASTRNEGDSRVLLRNSVLLAADPKNSTAHDAAQQSYFLYNKIDMPTIRTGGEIAGGRKWKHGELTDKLSMASTAATSFMRLGAAEPLVTALTGIAIQVVTNVISPILKTKALLQTIPEQDLHRAGRPQDLGGAGDLNGYTAQLIKAWWSGDPPQLRGALEEFHDAWRQHFSKYESGKHENYARIARSAVNLVVAEIAMVLGDRFPNVAPRIPLILLGQYAAVRLLWHLSASPCGPNQDTALQMGGVDTALHFRIPRIARDLYQRATGESLDYGPELAEAMATIDIDDTAMQDMGKLYAHQVLQRAERVQTTFTKEKTALLAELSTELGMPLEDLTERQVLRTQGVQPQDPSAEIQPAATAPVQEASERLHALDRAYDGHATQITPEQTTKVTQLQQKLDSITADIARIESGDEEQWAKISPDRLVYLIKNLAPTEAEIHASSEAAGSKRWDTQFFRECIPHLAKGFAKPWQLMGIGSNGGLQIMLGGFAVLAAQGRPLSLLIRGLAVFGHFCVLSVCEVIGGVLTAETVNIREWTKGRPTVPDRPAQWALILGLSIWGALVIPREALRLPVAMVTRAGATHSYERKMIATTTPGGVESGQARRLHPAQTEEPRAEQPAEQA